MEESGALDKLFCKLTIHFQPALYLADLLNIFVRFPSNSKSANFPITRIKAYKSWNHHYPMQKSMKNKLKEEKPLLEQLKSSLEDLKKGRITRLA